MSIVSYIKGKKKQREVRKLEPDINFEFEKEYYGDSNIIDGFNFLYCNNYTEKLINSKEMDKLRTEYLSYISCVISLPTEQKVINDLEYFINNYDDFSLFNYKNIHIVLGKEKTQLYIRGDISFYSRICNNIHNNIFTKYIRNNLFPDGIQIETPNEYLNNMYNSIQNPSKEVDILFIDNNTLFEDYKPIVGLSIKKNLLKNPINLSNKTNIELNNREITYFQIDKLDSEELNYLVANVRHGDKLLELVHKYKINNDYSDIDEIIEE